MYNIESTLVNVGSMFASILRIYLLRPRAFCFNIFSRPHLNLSLARIRRMVLQNFDGYYFARSLLPTFYNLQKRLLFYINKLSLAGFYKNSHRICIALELLSPGRKYLCQGTRGPRIDGSWSRALHVVPNDNPRRPGDCYRRRLRWPRWQLVCYAPSYRSSACCVAAAAVVAAAVAVGYGAATLQYYPQHSSHWRSGLPGRHHYPPSTKFFSVGGIHLIQKYLDVKRSPSVVEREELQAE